MHTTDSAASRLTPRHLQLVLLIDFLRYTHDSLRAALALESDLVEKSKDAAAVATLTEIEVKQVVSDYRAYQHLPTSSDKLHYLSEQLRAYIKSTQDTASTQNAASVQSAASTQDGAAVAAKTNPVAADASLVITYYVPPEFPIAARARATSGWASGWVGAPGTRRLAVCSLTSATRGLAV